MPDERSVDLSDSLAYLSIGSNVGEREATVLRVARALCEEHLVAGVRMSSLYETAPVACDPMDDFVNAVAEVQSCLCPRDLIKRLKELEARMGRDTGHNQPRIVDIDIVAYGDMLLDTRDLILPHPRYRSRSFVLLPLQEIAPGFQCPETGQRLDEMLRAIPAGQRVERISSRSVVCTEPGRVIPNHV